MWSHISLWHWFAFPCGWWGFPDSSIGKESACNAGDSGLIPGLGRSPGEEIGYPLQYSWASLVAQLVKTLPAMRETWIRSLGLEDPLEKGKVTHSSILAWRIPWTIYSPWVCKESDETERHSLSLLLGILIDRVVKISLYTFYWAHRKNSKKIIYNNSQNMTLISLLPMTWF